MGSVKKSDEETKRGTQRPHLLIVSGPGSGHFYPMLHLLYYCARYEGATITFVSNSARTAELSSLQSKGEFNGVDLRLEPLFRPTPSFFSDSIFPARAAAIFELFELDFGPFAAKLMQEKNLPGAPTCVIAEMFASFVQGLASQLDIPWYPFYVAAPAFALNLLESPKLSSEGLHPHTSPRRNEMFDIPGLKHARVRDGFLETLEFPQFFAIQSECTSKAAAILFNVAEELDAPAGGLEAMRVGTQLRARAEQHQGPRVLAIGPIVNLPGFTYAPSSTREISSASRKFLSSHAPSSVLYISFGTIGNIAPESLTELANGLEASGVPFLWVLKFTGPLASAVLPPGFEERVRGRGFIETGWAQQPQLLSHSSTGGFLSHCGWNSVLESLSTGVPLITWPLGGDQPLNARFVENVVKTGVAVKNYTPGDEKQLLPSREDVRRAVTLLMSEQRGKELRKNAEEMKTLVTAAVAEGGSSHKALHSFLEEILLRPDSHTNHLLNPLTPKRPTGGLS